VDRAPSLKSNHVGGPGFGFDHFNFKHSTAADDKEVVLTSTMALAAQPPTSVLEALSMNARITGISFPIGNNGRLTYPGNPEAGRRGRPIETIVRIPGRTAYP